MNAFDDSDSEMDTVQFKKTKLLSHLPFIEMMIIRTQGTELQQKWITMQRCIKSDKKKMTIAQIHQMDDTIEKLKTEHNEKKKPKEETTEQIPRLTMKPEVPMPKDLGKPVLSRDELQELIEELNGPSSSPPPLIPAPSFVMSSPVSKVNLDNLKRVPVTINKNPPPTVRLPSSCLPSLTTPPSSSKTENILGLPGSSPLRFPFKIPKLNRTPTSGSSTTSIPRTPTPENPKKQESVMKLKAINIFEGHEQSCKLLNPVRWDGKSPNHEKKLELKAESKATEKFKIIKAPSVDKKIQSTLKKSSDDPEPREEPEKKMKLGEAKGESKGEAKSDIKSDVKSDAKSEAQESPTKKSNDEQTLEDSYDQLSPKKKLELKMSKELRRLQENIVKDDAPLQSRRSCTLKRVSIPGETAVEDQEKQVAKRARNDPAPVEIKPSPVNKRKSVPAPVVPKSSPEPPIKNASRPTPYSSPARSPAVTPGRTTRNSAANDKMTKEFEMKQCSVALPQVTVDDAAALNKKQNQTARKSTAPSPPAQIRSPVIDKSPAPLTTESPNQGKIQVRAFATMCKEDVVESDTTSEGSSKHSDEPPKASTFDFKNIYNIAYTHCQSGAIYKCLVQGCRFQTIKKQEFMTHLECKHIAVKWNGYCNVCLKTVGGKSTIFSEFNHMREDHIMKEKVDAPMLMRAVQREHDTGSSEKSSGKSSEKSFEKFEKLFEKSSEKIKKSSEKSSSPEADSDIIMGIDSILKELLPATTRDRNTTIAPAMIRKMPVAPASSKQIATIVPLQSTPPAVKQVVISKNFVGRVIPIAGLTGSIIGKINTIGSGLAQNLKLPLQIGSIESPQISFPPKVISQQPAQAQSIVKYVIEKPSAGTKPLVGSAANKSVNINVTSTLSPRDSPDPTAQPSLAQPSLAQPSLAQPSLAQPSPAQPTPAQPSPAQPSQAGVDQRIKFTPLAQTANISLSSGNKATVKDALVYQEILRPWLGVRTNKGVHVTAAMCLPEALIATYKCLGHNCKFFSNDSSVFHMHLTFHEKFTSSDRDNFMSCAYCRFVCKTKAMDLVNHIKNEHGFDCYQCKYCFYRSCVDFNVLKHQTLFHNMRPSFIWLLELKEKRNEVLEVELVKKIRADNVPPIVCVFCKAAFYTFRTFLDHINAHTNTLNTKCIKCNERTTKPTLYKHLTKCHGFGLFQCVYCRFGTNTFEIISNHIAVEHPSKEPLFCERTENKALMNQQELPPSSIDSTLLKKISQQVNFMITRKAPNNEKQLKNYEKVGHLGEDIVVQGFETNNQAQFAEEIDVHPTRPQTQIKRIIDQSPTVIRRTAIASKPAQNQLIKGSIGFQPMMRPSIPQKFIIKHQPDRRPPFPKQMNIQKQLKIQLKPIPIGDSNQKKFYGPTMMQTKTPIAIAPPKSVGLKIENVFSLNEGLNQGTQSRQS